MLNEQEKQELIELIENPVENTEYSRFSSLFTLVMTEGVKAVVEKAESYWLLDVIGSYQPQISRQHKKLKEFQFWKLDVDLEKTSCVVTCREDVDSEPLITQFIEFTTFPLSEIILFVANNVIYLPNED